MNPLYISELFILVCENLTDKEIFRLESLSHFHSNLIKTYVWKHFTFRINGYFPKMKNALRKNQFRSIEFVPATQVNDKYMKLLQYQKNLKDFKAVICEITDKYICYLHSCESVNLNNTLITGECLKHLTNCKTLTISNNHRINNTGLEYIGKHFKNILYLNIENTNISDTGVQYIGHIPSLILCRNIITNNCIKYLMNCFFLLMSTKHVLLRNI